MLIASFLLLYHLLFGGAGSPIETLFTDIKGPIEAAVQQESRQAELIKLSDDLSDYLTESAEAWDAQVEKLMRIQVDYGANPLDFDAASLHLEQILARRHRRGLETRAAMKSLLSEEEWAAVFSKD